MFAEEPCTLLPDEPLDLTPAFADPLPDTELFILSAMAWVSLSIIICWWKLSPPEPAENEFLSAFLPPPFCLWSVLTGFPFILAFRTMLRSFRSAMENILKKSQLKKKLDVKRPIMQSLVFVCWLYFILNTLSCFLYIKLQILTCNPFRLQNSQICHRKTFAQSAFDCYVLKIVKLW